MAEIRMTMAEALASHDVDRVRIADTTEAEVQRYMREDGEEADGDGEQDVHNASAALVRARTGLSQAAFADAVGLQVATWRNWEQGRTRIEPAGLALLRLLAADPVGALATLRRAKAEAGR